MPPPNAYSSPSVRAMAEPFVSSLRTQAEVDALCKKHGVPSVYIARPAGSHLRPSSRPPLGTVCLYAHALEAGMRVPLHPFFSEALTHFGLASAQLTPDGWRVLVGFVLLCNSAGVVSPSLAVFRSFFSLREAVEHGTGWYSFCSKDGSLKARMSHGLKDWKRGFFFLSSPEPWPCPVEWGEPSEDSVADPVLTDEEKKWAAQLLWTNGGAAVGLKTYICGANHAAGALIAAASPPPPPPRVVKTEQDSHAPCRSSPLSGRKRKFEVANAEQSVARSVLKTPPPIPGFSVFGGACSPPPGFTMLTRGANPQIVPDRHDGDSAGWETARKVLECVVTPSREREFAAAKPSDVIAASYVAVLQAANYASSSMGYALELEGNPQSLPDRHDGDIADWEAARKVLESVVTPSREREFAAAKPSDVIASSYVAILQAANYASFSLGYALELEGKLAERDAEVATLREQLENATSELAATKAKLESAQATVVQQFVMSNDDHGSPGTLWRDTMLRASSCRRPTGGLSK